ncbi:MULTISPECIES: hypothetical protein [unclassified Symbiopectobacterium]|uniref:hypothetical protein n=1 Tax=unclassified Symbiopectobacterium TaxID=2794573 RepID=UPI0022276868|nr:MULTISPECIES: hypothetical protein [unclassified Symbiopectobacterium]MCW2473256.1 hypothetical protein [Candidatus Symbiopectobacterium sp. NZEC151]MCW2482176.1 hypothetical protein [Candidatus Symbiopectobacterium sp. NZEC135]
MNMAPVNRNIELQVRALMILEASRGAGITPLPAEVFHNIAYFANILAPIYSAKALDGKVLRLKNGPYYPELQNQLDWLVLGGYIKISNLQYHYLDDLNNWRVFADYELNIEKASSTIEHLNSWRSEYEMFTFLKKLTLALTELSDKDIINSNEFDATYADQSVDFGNVIDFGEWVHDNPSVNAAEFVQESLPNYLITKELKLNFYIRHLSQKLLMGRVAK